MRQKPITFLLASAIWLSWSVSGWTQADHDVAYWLDRDATVLVNIGDVGTTYNQIKKLELFSNPRFVKAIQMLADDRFPIIDAKSSEEIMSRLFELETLVRSIKQISFAVHDLDDKQFHWSLFIRAESDALDKIQNGMQGIDDQLEKSVQPDKQVDPHDGPDDSRNDPGQPDVDDHRLGEFRRVGEWLILSNHDSFLDALADRIGDESFRSLGKSRKYQSIKKCQSPLNDRDGLITIYGNPVRMRNFFPGATQSDWDSWKISELPACGLNLVITDSMDGDQPRPLMLADAVVQYTRPAVGWAKSFQFYRGIEVPPLAVEPIEFVAFSRDEAALFEDSVNRIREQNGQDSAGDFWDNFVNEMGLDNVADVFARRQACYDMRFIGENQTADRPGLVSMERLLDSKAAYRFANGVARMAQNNFGQKLIESEDGADIWWAIPAEQFAKNSGLEGIARKRNSDTEYFNCKHDAYVLADKWWVQGDMPAVSEQVKLLTTGDGQDHSQSIQDLVKDMTRRLNADEKPLIIKYFTKDSWRENLNNIEQQYANSHGRPVELKFKLVQGQGSHVVLELDQDTNPAAGIGEGSFEIQLERNPDEPSNGNDAQPLKQLSLSSLQSIQMMMPMKLLDRNDDGHRIELTNRGSLATAIRVMIFTSIAESFPRQLLLYTRNDNNIRIMLGVYPSVNPENAP